MKKTLVTILTGMISLFISCSFGQGAKGFIYEDALTLLNTLEGDQSEKVINHIIGYYSAKPHMTREEINTIIRENPFLKENKFLQKYSTEGISEEAEISGVATGTLSGLFGLNVTNYADGLAKFLIERGKQELSMAFFDKMRKEFQEYPELKSLFPLTVQILENIENHNILTLLQELKDAFTKDLLNEPTNILSLRNLKELSCEGNEREKKRCEERNKSIRAIKAAADTKIAAISLLIAQGIIDGNNIIVVLGTIVNDTKFCTGKDMTDGYLKFVYILMEMLRTKESDGLFINEVSLRNLFFNKELLNLFLGLGFERYNSMVCFNTANLNIGGKTLQKVFQAMLDKRSNLSGILSSLDNVNFAYTTIKRQLNQGLAVDNSTYASFISGSMLAVANITKCVPILVDTSALPKKVEQVLINMDISSDLVIDIQQRNYTGIFNDVIRYMNQNNIISSQDSKEKIVKYLSFAANMASAENSDEVKEALNAATLPPGSFSIKQKSAWNIALNAYVGYAWDYNGGLYGRNVYAPVGVAFSKGLSKKHGGAVSIFTSLIDVGSLVSYRLTNGMTDSLKQEVRLESIISPSAQLVFAFPKLPIAVCAGWRKTPRLVFEGQKEFTVVSPKDVFNLSILIDIPMFNIWNRPYE